MPNVTGGRTIEIDRNRKQSQVADSRVRDGRATDGRASNSRAKSRTVNWKTLATGALAVGILIMILFMNRLPPEETQRRPFAMATDLETPESTLTTMIEQARSGDTDAYLRCFAGDLAQRMKSRLQSDSSGRARVELRQREAGLKSHVTADWENLGPDESACTLERVYADYNERHRVRLRRLGAEWKIVELEPIQRFAPRIPYGTPVDAASVDQPANVSQP